MTKFKIFSLESVSLIAGVLSASVAVYAYLAASDESKHIGQPPTTISVTTSAQELSTLRTEIEQIRNSLSQFQSLPNTGKLQVQLNVLKAAVADLKSRQQIIEQGLLNTPEKALQLPILHRELEAQKALHQANASALKESIDRIYDINKWLLGGMAVSVLTLALGNLMRGKRNTEGKSQGDA
jgi:hypothetical protein